MVPPKTNFFSFLKPWADNSSTNQYSYQLFYGWGMTHLVPSYLKNACCRRGAGETPSALRCLYYLISNFLTDIKHLAKDLAGGTLSAPFWCLCQKRSLSLLYFNKALLPEKAHSSILARKIPWMEEPGRLQSMGSLRVGHDWATSLSLAFPMER